MVNIVALGIGYGTPQRIQGYAFLAPNNLGSVREELYRSGVGIRDVVGFMVYQESDPRKVVLVHNLPTASSGAGEVSKGVLGHITPLGGKVDNVYKDMAKAGLISFETAYAARGFVGEADELGCPNDLSLKLLNRVQGLPYSNTLSSPDGKDLYVDGNFVRRFEYLQDGGVKQLVYLDEDFKNYSPLTNINVTYAIGLFREDQKNCVHTATAVANVWIPANDSELEELGKFVRRAKVDGMSEMELVDVRHFGDKKHPTTVSNMMAAGLYVKADKDTYNALTGRDKPSNLPVLGRMHAFKHAYRHECSSIEEVVRHFRKTMP